MKKLQAVRTKKTDEVRYRKSLLALLLPIFSNVHKKIIPDLESLEKEYVADDWADDLNDGFNVLEKLWKNNTRFVSKIAESFVNNILKTNEQRISVSFKKSLGADVLTSEPNLAPQIKSRNKENINLINSLGQTYIDKVETVIYEGASNGLRASELSKQIRELTMVTENRAKFIAIDQTLKFNASLNKTRMLNLGVKKYIWHNVNDSRVRGNPAGIYPNSKHNHWSREGKIFEYSKPPPGGNPGEDYRCRCFAEPIFDDDKFVKVV